LRVKFIISTFASTNQNKQIMDLLTAQKLANTYLVKYDLHTQGWRFQFDNARRRFGCCNYRTKRITLSKHLTALNDVKEVNNTILHEIAHALTPGHHHDRVWQRKAIEIGCNGKRCYSSKEVVSPESKYIAVCVGCNHTYKKHKMMNRNAKHSCGKCSGGRFNATYILEFKLNPKYPH
jgi:predicted SprT family Zn-dependent metalloprotease